VALQKCKALPENKMPSLKMKIPPLKQMKNYAFIRFSVPNTLRKFHHIFM
jgi:hypothetical protein